MNRFSCRVFSVLAFFVFSFASQAVLAQCANPIALAELQSKIAIGFTTDPISNPSDMELASAGYQTRGFVDVERATTNPDYDVNWQEIVPDQCETDPFFIYLNLIAGSPDWTPQERIDRVIEFAGWFSNFEVRIDGAPIDPARIISTAAQDGFQPIPEGPNYGLMRASTFFGVIVNPMELLPGPHSAQMDFDLEFPGQPIQHISLPINFNITGNTNTEPMAFSYTFDGGRADQPWATGSVLAGEIIGTIDPADRNRVIIDSIGTVTLSRPGFPLFTFPSIEDSEFNTYPFGDTPHMTFDGSAVDFRACPSGFTNPDGPTGVPFQDCPFADEGGFHIGDVVPFDPNGWASAADGSGDAVCDAATYGGNGARGCRVTDRPYNPDNWTLARLDPDQDGIRREVDNCPDVANANQTDTDANGYGDVCELGTTQDFGDGGDPYIGNGLFCYACLVNGWTGEASLDTGDAGTGDHTLIYEATGGGFHALTWEHYALADIGFLGDFIANGVSAVRFKARHSGIGDPVMLRAFIFDTFDDGTTDALISNDSEEISNMGLGLTWQEYMIDLDPSLDLTPWFGNTNSANDILSGVAQFGLRHDPGGEGPGSQDLVIATVYLDDIQLIIDPDLDDDGIANEIDTMRLIASSEFDDGTTNGVITDPGSQFLTVTDEPDPDGVRILADAGGGPQPARVSVCGAAATLTLNASDDTLVKCTSVQVIVIAGEIEMEVVVNGQPAIVSVPANNELTFIPETPTEAASFSAPPSNPDPVVVSIAGAEVTIEPGESFDIEPFRRFSADLEIDDDEIELSGDFKLGAGTDGINPKKEDVTITVGGMSWTIPSGSFDKDGGEFEFEGRIDGDDLDVEIERIGGKRYEFEIEAETGIGGGSAPVEVTLLIGNDTGTIHVVPDDDD